MEFSSSLWTDSNGTFSFCGLISLSSSPSPFQSAPPFPVLVEKGITPIEESKTHRKLIKNKLTTILAFLLESFCSTLQCQSGVSISLLQHPELTARKPHPLFNRFQKISSMLTDKILLQNKKKINPSPYLSFRLCFPIAILR